MKNLNKSNGNNIKLLYSLIVIIIILFIVAENLQSNKKRLTERQFLSNFSQRYEFCKNLIKESEIKKICGIDAELMQNVQPFPEMYGRDTYGKTWQDNQSFYWYCEAGYSKSTELDLAKNENITPYPKSVIYEIFYYKSKQEALLWYDKVLSDTKDLAASTNTLTDGYKTTYKESHMHGDKEFTRIFSYINNSKTNWRSTINYVLAGDKIIIIAVKHPLAEENAICTGKDSQLIEIAMKNAGI